MPHHLKRLSDVRRRAAGVVVSGWSCSALPGRAHNCRVRIVAALIIVFAVATAAAGQTWKAPRTPWGDPDLQGTYSNSNEYATPLERPARFEGRRLEDITSAEMAQIRQAAEQQAIDGLAPGPRGPDYWWLENLNLSKRSQAWSVVDPPDGRIPALTAEAKQRGAGPPRTSFAGGPFNGPQDLGFLERCITRSIPGSMIPVMYGNNYQIVQTPGFVVITYEIIHEARVIPLDGRPHVGPGLRMHMGDARGHWDGDTLVVETTNFTTIPRPSASSNASSASPPTRLRGPRRSRIRRRGPGRGRSRCR